ncbi:hypothetical protein BLA17378_08623 [Burkholderia aenigmatica]|uniref:Uncharacterized protein n=1 Tax=Burkholderia aenigmatica TaxID=2015348 RepID=A0ABY6YBB0_9BURK|nr:hypothetical protein [Burkholderia aenigmatica]VWD49637.1 hypothetical protein BLA17378_08623 [Burkholderia aenigmatica]
MSTKYAGNDNYGRPKSEYLAKIAAMDDEKLASETYQMIYHSARCNNNPRADWHWMVDACYDECKKRPGDIYQKAWDECYQDHAR